MIINAQALRTLNVGFSTLFNKGFSSKQTKYPLIATEVPSSTSEENYGWIGQLPKMKKWLDERTIANLSAYTYTIRNESFESTIGIDRDTLEDDRYGVYAPSFEMMGAEAASAPDETVFDLLQKGFTEKCYDGNPFFSDGHVSGKKTFSNKSDAKLTQESFIEARTAMMSYTGDQEKPLKIVPNLLLVPPALEMEARRILEAEMISGSSNITRGLAKVEVVSELANDPDAWYLMATNEPLKPMILQMRKKPKFTALNRDDDLNVFLKKTYLYGVDGRWNAGYGFWQMAYGSTGKGAVKEESSGEASGEAKG